MNDLASDNHQRELLWRIPAAADIVAVMREWLGEQGLYWATSVTAHALLLSIGLMIAGAVYVLPKMEGAAPTFEAAEIDTTVLDIDISNFADTPIDPPGVIECPSFPTTASAVDPGSLMGDADPGEIDVGSVEQGATAGITAGGSLTDQIWRSQCNWGPGPRQSGPGDGSGPGTGRNGPPGFPSRTGRHYPHGDMTGPSENAAAAALVWLARHQRSDGSWSLAGYQERCRDGSCSGPGTVCADSAATPLGLLPFLAAGHTHTKRGKYQQQVRGGLTWLRENQTENGDLSGGSESPMYAHAIATIAMCEAYGMSGDKYCAAAAQRAVQFIERAQNKQTGGWRYQPGETGDTSVVGWMVMALKSAQMAGLSVSSESLDGAKRWLVAAGDGHGQFSYEIGSGGTPPMSAVGCLCSQYLGAARQDPVVVGGQALLAVNAPNWRSGTRITVITPRK